jgi:hypothetical protein
MTREELVTRARERALEEKVQAFKISGSYVSPSRSNPGVAWELGVGQDGEVWCSCPGFTYRQNCKHSEALKLRLQREGNSKAHLCDHCGSVMVGIEREGPRQGAYECHNKDCDRSIYADFLNG